MLLDRNSTVSYQGRGKLNDFQGSNNIVKSASKKDHIIYSGRLGKIISHSSEQLYASFTPFEQCS